MQTVNPNCGSAVRGGAGSKLAVQNAGVVREVAGGGSGARRQTGGSGAERGGRQVAHAKTVMAGRVRSENRERMQAESSNCGGSAVQPGGEVNRSSMLRNGGRRCAGSSAAGGAQRKRT